MTGQQVTQVFGPNMPSRLVGAAQMMVEAGEVAPTLPWYQPLVPFYPPQITPGVPAADGSLGSLTLDGHKIWEKTPSQCDLLFYQGDDVIIPFYFGALTEGDMSGDAWFAQIRILHRYQSKLIAEFVTTAEYSPPVPEVPPLPPDEPGSPAVPGYTMVELFLPRTENDCYGQFRWDLYSVSAEDLSRFPKPPETDPTQWPPDDILRTWLYGVATIVPRVTSTDTLYHPSEPPLIPWPGPPPEVSVVTTGGWFVGPNGRVP